MKFIYLPNIISITDIPKINNKHNIIDLSLKKKIYNVTQKFDRYPEKFSKFQICKIKNNNRIEYKKDLCETTLTEIWTLYVNIDKSVYGFRDNCDDISQLLYERDGLLINELYDDVLFDGLPTNKNILVKKVY